MSAPEDSIAFANEQLRAALDRADYWAQQGMERLGIAPNLRADVHKLRVVRVKLMELVLIMPDHDSPAVPS